MLGASIHSRLLVVPLRDHYDCGVEPFESLSILVTPKCRQRGVGKALISRWVKEVEKRGRVARYRANRENIASRRLCESLGFVAHSHIQILAKL
ncbi:GNAT family N-acetyltransferase [Salinivibrio sp. IB282]|uniref:GNAT family N-acetyltransferase n=1 Tax=Salinivibrio sp. IB282 TaxID=1766122 RepID=UPI0018E32B5B|nr:GNAT family N-acetyltransferase [Salinivibrio sp. IB282]